MPRYTDDDADTEVPAYADLEKSVELELAVCLSGGAHCHHRLYVVVPVNPLHTIP